MQRGTIRRRRRLSSSSSSSDNPRPSQRHRGSTDPSSSTPTVASNSMTVTADTSSDHNMGVPTVSHSGNSNGASSSTVTSVPPTTEDGPYTLPYELLDHVRPYHPPGSLMYDDDRDWRPEFDDGNVSMTHYSGSDADAVARRKRTFGKRMPINREEVVRLMLQGLHDMGYGQAADVLSKESGYSLATPTTLAFQDAVAGGRWSEALALLPEMGISHSPKSASIHGLADLQNEMPNPIDHATFLIARQKYLEYLEAGQHKKALSVLRTELAASGCPPDVLHNLSGYMMCSDRDDLYGRAEWDGAAGISRRLLLERLQEHISPKVMVPSRRLASLLDQARQHQQQNCLYHDNGGPISLYHDHQCVSGAFPSVTTHVLADHTDEVWRIEWSPDGDLLASASKDKTAVIWKLKPPQDGSTQYSMAPLFHLRGHRSGVDAIAWSPDGQTLITGSDRQIYVWDVKTGTRKATPTNTTSRHEDTISAIQWMPDGSQFVVSSLDQQIIFYDRNGGFLRQWTTLNLQVSDFAITPDGTRIVAATTAVQRVRVGDKLKPSISVRDDSGSNQAFERMPHGVHIIRISDNEILHYISDINASDVTSVRLSHDGQRVLLSCAPDELQMFSIEPHLHFMRKFVGHVQSRFIIRSAFGAPKDRFVLSGSEDGHVYVWQNSAATPLEVLSGHRDTVNAVAWNPVLSRKLFASCSDDTEIRIWQPPLPGDEDEAEGMEL